MAIQGVDTKCYILALFIRDDDERFLLGSGQFEFKDSQKQFEANAIQNDVVEVQGNDGYLLAGQVRRSGTQNFDGYVGDGTMAKTEVEENRRKFFAFYQKNHFYRVVYVFPDGTAIQRKRGFLVDDPTVEELYQQYPEYHVALNFEDVNYYTYSENEQGEEIYAEEAIIDLSVLRATGGLIWDEYGAVSDGFAWGGETTATGSEITIQNELDLPAPVSDVRLNGDSEQQTYSGINLLPPPQNFEQDVNGLMVKCVNGEYTINGNASSGTSTGVKNTIAEYTIQAGDYFHYNNDLVSSRINISLRFSDNTQFATSMNVANRIISLADYVGKTVVGVNVNFNSGYDFSGTAKPMILNGVSTVTPFEPYVGGVPAPNPDYPQDIEVVTGEQTVALTGKNLYGVDQAPSTSAGITWTKSGNTVHGAGIASSTWGYIAEYSSITNGMPPGTYTLSIADSLPSPVRLQLRLLKADNTSSTFTMPAGANTYTFTTSDTYVSARMALTNLTSSTSYDITVKDIQIEASSTATAYEPYQSQSYTIDLGSIELCKIGNYQDYIYKSGDDWYVHKEVGKYTIDGTPNWTVQNAKTNYTYYQTTAHIFAPTPANIVPTALSTQFIVASGYTANNSDTAPYFAFNVSGYLRVNVANADFADAAALKTHFTSNPMDVYYPLATPTDTQITDSALIAQLNALGKMKLFVGENNVLVSASGTNLPGELTLTYYTTLDTTGSGYVWEEGGSGGPTMVEIESITNVYPIWKVFGPAVNPELSILTTNTTLTYNGTVASGQYLVIDMMNKTAKLNGTSVIGNVSGDWVNLRPGVNRVVYATDNSDTPSSIIEWQEVVG